MAEQRCGCGDTCTCKIQAGTGTKVSGAGTANNPYVVGFDPSNGDVIGPGLFWNAQDKELSAFISGDPNNAMSIGTDAGLYVPSSGEKLPPDVGGATVAALPQTGITAGFSGAGYLHTPENLTRSYQRAVTLGLHMAHVPVQTLRDGVTVVLSTPDVSRVSEGYETFKPGEVDTMRWGKWTQAATLYYMTGSTLGSAFVPTTGLHSRPNPADGFFGFSEGPQQGGTFVTDIAHAVGGRIVLIFQIFTAAEQADLQRIIRRYWLEKSSIVLSGDLSLLAPFNQMGVATGGAVSSRAEFDRNTPQALADAGATWAFVSLIAGLTVDEMRTYPQAGLSSLAFPAQFHNEQRLLNRPINQGGYGYRGAITADPVYYNGPVNNYIYRHHQSSWDQLTVEYGQYTDFRGIGKLNNPEYRGYPVWGHNSLFLPQPASWRSAGYPNAGHETTGPWWIMQGWQCPLEKDQDGSFTLAWWSRWLAYNDGSAENFMCVAWGQEGDSVLRTGPQSGFNYPNNAVYAVKWEWGVGGTSYFEDWRGSGQFQRYPFTRTSDQQPLHPGLGIGAYDDLLQNTIESCHGVQVDGAAGTVTLVEGAINRDTGILTGQTTSYTHAENLHTGDYLWLGKCGQSDWPVDNVSVSFRHFDTKPGVRSLQTMFPWAT